MMEFLLVVSAIFVCYLLGVSIITTGINCYHHGEYRADASNLFKVTFGIFVYFVPFVLFLMNGLIVLNAWVTILIILGLAGAGVRLHRCNKQKVEERNGVISFIALLIALGLNYMAGVYQAAYTVLKGLVQ